MAFPYFSKHSNVVAKILLVGLLYVLLGRIAVLLAIPPGYAMAIYPPAGVALAAVLIGGWRMAIGVGLGSLSLNLWIGWERRPYLDLAALQLPCIIAIGAMLQACFSSWLIKRTVGYPLALDGHRSISQFMLFGGIFGSTISAAVGVSGLYFHGIIDSASIANNWLTWWFGDCLGVLIVAPIGLILAGQPRSIWRARRLNVMIPLLLTLCMVVAVFVFVRQWEQARLESEFRDRAQRLIHAVQARIDYHVEVQKSVAALFASVEKVNSKQFSNFVAQPISNFSALQAIVWAPLVADTDRASWESSQLVDKTVEITQNNSHQQIVPAAVRDVYFPAKFVAPILGNNQLLGFDLASLPAMRNTVEEARDIGLVVASPPQPLMLSEPNQMMASFVSPVYDSDLLGVSVAERRRAFSGAVISILNLGQVIESVLGPSEKNSFLIRLVDVPQNGMRYVYFDTIKDLPSLHDFSAGKNLNFSLDLAGRELQLAMRPSAAYLQQQQAWAAWASLVGGMLFTGIVGMYLLVVSGRSFGIESLVKERTMQLANSQQRLHAILDNAADGILTVGENGQITLVNRALCQLLAADGNDLSQKFFSTLFISENRGMPIEKLFEVNSQTHHETRTFGRDLYAMRADNTMVPVELSVARVGGGQDWFHIVVVHDLTERKRIDQMKGDFVSAVSHELRTPLTSIRGSLGLLVGGIGGQLPEQASKLLKMANENAERLSALINDLLDFEKLEYGGMRFEYARHDLVQIVQQAVETNQGYAQKFSVKLVLQSQENHVPVNVDDSRLIQVLSNLLSNAIKFSPPQSSVEIALTRAAGYCKIAVIDHGTGIAESYKPRIFEKFSQADGSVRRKYAGTGLGLSLAKLMIEKMGGEIGFTSIEGQGATFYIILPLLDVSSVPENDVRPEVTCQGQE